MRVLNVKNLSTYYNTKVGYNQALDDLSFELFQGEMLGLIGESGCGIIMYAGHLVEIAGANEIKSNSRHPYTQALFSSQVNVNDFNERVESISGVVPKLINPDDKCRFYSRCKKKIDMCSLSAPKLREINKSHSVACYLEV